MPSIPNQPRLERASTKMARKGGPISIDNKVRQYIYDAASRAQARDKDAIMVEIVTGAHIALMERLQISIQQATDMLTAPDMVETIVEQAEGVASLRVQARPPCPHPTGDFIRYKADGSPYGENVPVQNALTIRRKQLAEVGHDILCDAMAGT
jgi:hypothetical protein